jgi:hypothetical protein
MLHRLTGWRHAVVGALVGLEEDLLGLRLRVVAAGLELLGGQLVGTLLHSLRIGFLVHRVVVPSHAGSEPDAVIACP